MVLGSFDLRQKTTTAAINPKITASRTPITTERLVWLSVEFPFLLWVEVDVGGFVVVGWLGWLVVWGLGVGMGAFGLGAACVFGEVKIGVKVTVPTLKLSLWS